MRYFFGFLVSVGLIILVVILVIKGFTSGPKKTIQAPLADYASTSTVMRMTVYGPIVSDQQFRSYQVTVGQNQTTITTRQGYDYTTIDQHTYSNNQQGYTNFLRALDLAGYTKSNKVSTNKDERGACAIGQRLVFEIQDGNNEVQRSWTTTCHGQGNFKGNTQSVRRLFNTQIPTADFNKLTGPLQLN